MSSNGCRKSRKELIEEIEGSVALKAQLEQWEREETLLKARIDLKELKYSSIHNDIYQLLGMFFVFQGVILTAVAQAQALTCKNWWSPFTLSLLASFGALGALIQKLIASRKFQQLLQKDKRQARNLFYCIRDLRAQGGSFDLDSDPGRSQRSECRTRKRVSLVKRIISTGSLYVFCYGAALISVVLLFSSVTLASCITILCYAHS